MNEKLEKLSDDVRRIKALVYVIDELEEQILPNYNQTELVNVIQEMICLFKDVVKTVEADIAEMYRTKGI